jgi:glutathione synthase/RimK-type ligase-like ATP-grasp enzyme
MRFALARCAVLPEPDPDEAPLVAALHALGHEGVGVAWDAPEGAAESLARFDAIVLRATWNYAQHAEAFRDWLDAAARATVMINPLSLVRANLHKRYLLDLASRGVPTVPTEFVDRGGRADVRAIAAANQWDAVVIKPAVSAGSYRTSRFDAPQFDAAQAFLDDMVAGPTDARDAMIQRFEPAVARGGEVNLIWIDGIVTHAISKRPRFAGQHEDVTAHTRITDEEHGFARRVLDAAEGQRGVVFARIDTFRDDSGQLMLSELELIEPSLFFAHGPGAAARLARAIVARVRRPRTP